MSVLTTILYFVLLIGVLVFVHEGGHFLVAKLFDVKVHVFSLGFGPRLFGVRRGETDYRISAVPIGGFVKMLGEDPSEVAGPEDAGRAFTDKPRWQRFCIIAAGPAMNLIFPLFLHFGVGIAVSGTAAAPEIGFVVPGSPGAAAGLLPGDVITAIDGEPVATFEDMSYHVRPRPGQPLRFELVRDGEPFARTIAPAAVRRPILGSEKETVGQIGVYASYPVAVVGVEDHRGAAAAAGVETFDKIVSVDGKPVERLLDASRAVAAAAGRTAALAVLRMRGDAEPPLDAADYAAEPRAVRVAVPAGATGIEALGLAGIADFVSWVDPEGPAAAIGLRRGDRLVSLDGDLHGGLQIERGLASSPDICHVLAWRRGGVEMAAPFKPRFIPAGEKKDFGIAQDAYSVGYSINMPFVDREIENPARLKSALRYAWTETGNNYRDMGIGAKLLFRREVSVESIGGFLMIGQLAGMAGEEGPATFVWLMALISLNLGFINLLPIPVLDGGQIAIIAAEAVTRRPMSRKLKERIMLVGLVMIVALMLFATRNDIMRLLLDK